MQLSVIIVNYNVKYFLEQCLQSVEKARKNLDIEVFVVDNNSVDGSCAMVKEKFSNVYLIENKENTGFSYANNQAIKISNGKYVLLLNPDTVVEECTFKKIIHFMDENPQAGALGVKMIDGNGNFLPESKRALPTPEVSFYKIFGLSSLFSKSKKFGKYHLSYLDKDEIHEIEILSGAFMLMRKEALDKVGLLDETFFMYGEDIDLSYRIIKGGYKNYYFPETTIIHYKGESTKKGSINYVKIFYKAMIIFAEKHFSQKNAKIFSFFINLAVYFRAILALGNRFLKAIFLPLLDFLSVFLGFYVIKPYWETYKFGEANSYPDTFLSYAVPFYILILILNIYFIGGYKKPIKLNKVAKGILIGTVFILMIYGLLNETYRFSRALIFIGALLALFFTGFNRFILNFLKFKDYQLDFKKKKKMVIIGSKDESKRVANLLQQIDLQVNIIGFVNIEKIKNNFFIGNITQIKEIVNIHKIDEIIFCAKDISSQEIISNMLKLANLSIEYKIAPKESLSIIGSNSIDTAGDLYVINMNSIAKEESKRRKRILDILVSLSFTFFIIFIIFFIEKRGNFLKNIYKVFSGKLTWISYIIHKDIKTSHLPSIKKGILSPLIIHQNKNISVQNMNTLNIIYAKNYTIWNDLFMIYKGFKKLGN